MGVEGFKWVIVIKMSLTCVGASPILMSLIPVLPGHVLEWTISWENVVFPFCVFITNFKWTKIYYVNMFTLFNIFLKLWWYLYIENTNKIQNMHPLSFFLDILSCYKFYFIFLHEKLCRLMTLCLEYSCLFQVIPLPIKITIALNSPGFLSSIEVVIGMSRDFTKHKLLTYTCSRAWRTLYTVTLLLGVVAFLSLLLLCHWTARKGEIASL